MQSVYAQSIFPEIKTDWRAHPDNIGHRDYPGCFRCHNDEMEAEDGTTIFTSCTKCHVVLAQAGGGSAAEEKTDFRTGQAFVHPDDDDTFEEYTNCTDCHDGGAGVYD